MATTAQFQLVRGAGQMPHGSRCWRFVLIMIAIASTCLGAMLCVLTNRLRGPAPGGGSPRTGTGLALRLRIKGKRIFEPGSSTPIVLRGFNLMFKYGTADMDRVLPLDRSLRDLVPGVSLVRVIANHWDDDVTTQSGHDCYDEASVDFILPACLAMFDEVVDWATQELRSWVILTARSALGAGDGGPGRTIFDNVTRRAHWLTMWGALAKRYANVDRVAGFEVMSEPRTYAPAALVHTCQQAACSAVWAQDPRAACVVGPARFYDRFNLNSSYLIEGGPVIYSAK